MMNKRKLCQALMIALAMLLIQIGSREHSVAGFIDRLVQFVMATALLYFAVDDSHGNPT